MYRSTQWLNAQFAFASSAPQAARVPIALVVTAMVVTAFTLTLAVCGIGMHQSVTASDIA